DADQQQIERIGKAAFDLRLPVLNLVLEEQVRQVHAGICTKQADAQLDCRGLVEIDHDKQVKCGSQQRERRRDQAEEQKGDVGRLPAIARLHQFGARFLLSQPFVQIKLVD